MKYTPEQIAFKNAVINPDDSSSIVLEAVAGSGKTTSIISPLKELVNKTVAIVAFNKSIATELQDKLKKLNIPNNVAQAGTCHSYGFNTYKSLHKYIEVKGNKVYNIVEDYFAAREYLPVVMKAMIRKLVSIGKQYGAGDLSIDPRMGFDVNDHSKWSEFIYTYDINDSDVISDEEIIKHTIVVLRLSNKLQKIIDFDDMIYLPLLMNLRFPKFDIVMIDEAQDVNWARREMAARMLTIEERVDEYGEVTEHITGRLIAVGDRRQAIYGFTGAGSDSLDQIKAKFNCVEYPLSVCFRCDRSIVEFSQKWNPMIQPSPSANEGTIKSILFDDFMKEKHTKEKVMLCRNTKPLVQVAFQMIRAGIAVYVEGRDIGEGLKNLAQKWKITKIDTLVDRLNTFKDRETAKARAKNNDAKIQYIEDQVDTLMVIINRCREANKFTVQDVIDEINFLFKDTVGGADRFTLSTIHKSKGREWETVYWLDRLGTLPSKYAKQAWQIQQESNLCYVAATRAKHELIEVTL